jgi:hypothetical protein
MHFDESRYMRKQCNTDPKETRFPSCYLATLLQHQLVDTPARQLRDVRSIAVCPHPICDLPEERVSI